MKRSLFARFSEEAVVVDTTSSCRDSLPEGTPLPPPSSVTSRPAPGRPSARSGSVPECSKLAEATLRQAEFRMQIDVAETWNPSKLLETRIHELGHTLGMEHTSTPGSIMHFQASKQQLSLSIERAVIRSFSERFPFQVPFQPAQNSARRTDPGDRAPAHCINVVRTGASGSHRVFVGPLFLRLPGPFLPRAARPQSCLRSCR